MIEPKMGGKPTLRLAIQESYDVVNSLLPRGEGGQELPGGLQALVRQKYDGVYDLEIARLPIGRSDLLLHQLDPLTAPGGAGQPTETQGLPERRAATQLIEQGPDVLVMSICPDLMQSTWRNPSSGHSVSSPLQSGPGGSQPESTWAAPLTPAGVTQADQFEENLLRIIKFIKQQVGAHVIVYNASPFDPDDKLYTFRGVDDTFALRTQRFNLALIRLSLAEGISIVDVERLVAELGASEHVTRPLRYSGQVYTAACGEVMRILEDIGFFERRPITMQVGQGRH